MIKRFIAACATLFILILIETQLLPNIFFLPVTPNLMLPAVIFFSLVFGSMFGQTAGFIGGLMLDFLSLSPLGLNAMFYMCLGFIGGRLSNMIIPGSFLVPAVLGLCATLFKALFAAALNFLFPLNPLFSFYLSAGFLFELLLNTLLSPLIFRLLGMFTPPAHKGGFK